jgi:fructose-1,6-bisphosphatase/inositol monophosphatase family enzyme
MSASDASQGNRSATVSTSTAIRAERRALLATCVAVAARAADVVRSGADRRDSLTWEVKGKHDFVTTVDRDSEAVIHEIVAQRHPDATILAEEGSPDASTTRGLVFVADPLDGTTNFLHGVPWYAVSIAALVDGEIMAGAVVNAATGALYTATAGGGARLAGAPIRVSDVSDPSRRRDRSLHPDGSRRHACDVGSSPRRRRRARPGRRRRRPIRGVLGTSPRTVGRRGRIAPRA